MDSLVQDIRYAVRLLIKRPGFTAIAVLTLTLGIGANTAIFTVVNSVLLQSLPYRDPGRLVWVSGTNAKNDIKDEGASLPDFIDWRDQNHTFDDMAALTGFIAQLRGASEPESVMGGGVSSNYFSVLGVMPQLGRNFSPDDAQPGKDNVIIVSDGFWKSRLAGDPKAIGRAITIGAQACTVIGVMPPAFINARPSDYKPMQIWRPMPLVSNNAQRRNDYLSVIGRLKPGISLSSAQSDLNGVAEELERLYPATNTGWRTNVVSLHDRWVGNVRPALLLLTAAVGFLLLIACANVANLLLARTAAREKEVAIRAALGAGRRRLVQQLLTESILLSAVGGALGILLAWWGARSLMALAPDMGPLAKPAINLNVLGFTVLVTFATGLLFGLLPAFHASGGGAFQGLKEGGRTSSEGIGGRRTRDMLAAAEIALALIMLIGAGLMIRSFIQLQRVDPGFKSDHLLVAMTIATRDKYHDGNQVDQFYNRLVSEVGSLPGIRGAAAVTEPPLTGESNVLAFQTEGKVVPPTEKTPDAEYATCTPGYFQMMGIPLVAGRAFNEFDTKESEPVVAVSQTLAHRYWPNENPIGKRLRFGPNAPWLTVVGVVGDTKSDGLSIPAYPQIYAPHAQDPDRAMFLIARTTSDPMSMAQTVKSRIWSVDNSQTFWVLETMDSMANRFLAGPRFNMLLMLIFAGLAAVIASVGIYGVISYSVSQRTREIGIRMAIGASKQEVLSLVVRQGLTVTIIGLAAGIAGAFALTRLMSSFLFSVTPTDPVTFAIVGVLLGTVALLASYIPARRATRVDPMVALRYE